MNATDTDKTAHVVCKNCGKGDLLFPDPAGYYRDAKHKIGYDLLCLYCRDPQHPTVIAKLKEIEKLKLVSLV